MVVESISVRDVRNLGACEVELGPGLNLLWGPNGAGKTNLLEAVHIALAGRSCRTRDDREAIAFGCRIGRASATVAAGERRRRFLCALTRAEGRRHLVDGVPAGPESGALRPELAVFMPDRLALIKGPPSSRRAHLDRFWSALWPARADSCGRYSRALAQRNALLGRIRAGDAGPAALKAWDRELAVAGVEVIGTRARALELVAPAFQRCAAALGLGPAPALRYRPRSTASDPAQLASELAERRGADVARGYTGWGPHLDEVLVELDGRALRRYGSQGQQRTALLALLFAERRTLLDDGRPPPLMLLDDVTSELDSRHRELLVDYLADGGGQALITATEPGHLPARGARQEIALRDGRALHAAAAAAESEAA
jgi:DNA replication and repair protein RecF